MKVKLDIPVTGLTGDPIKNDEGGEILLSKLVCDALLANEQNLDGHEKLKRFQIAATIAKTGQFEGTVDELAKVKDLTGKHLSTLVVGQLWPILEGG